MLFYNCSVKEEKKRMTLENEFEEIRKNTLRRNFQISLGFIRQDLKENLIKNGKDAGAQIPTELFISNDIIIQLYDDMKPIVTGKQIGRAHV